MIQLNLLYYPVLYYLTSYKDALKYIIESVRKLFQAHQQFCLQFGFIVCPVPVDLYIRQAGFQAPAFYFIPHILS